MALQINYKASPTGSQLHNNYDDLVRAIMGPVGSGKSVACIMEILLRAQLQEPSTSDGVTRKTRFGVIRNTYRELMDTTIRTFKEWIPDEIGTWHKADMMFTMEFPMPDGTVVHSEILFRALDTPDDVKKLLSLELTYAFCNEARELALTVIEMLIARVGRYPSKRDGGPTYYGIFMDTNPPDDDHWWYKLFEEKRPARWRLYKQPSGLSDRAENVDNLPAGYYDNISAGKDQEWVNVYVHGQYGFIMDGRPVFPEYKDTLHCPPSFGDHLPEFDPSAGALYIGLDFGLTPAAVFLQYRAEQWVALDELVTEGIGAITFAKELRRKIRSCFPHARSLEIWGDPAGDQRSATNESETVFTVLNDGGIPALAAPSQDPVTRREAVAKNLLSLSMTGQPKLVISPKCKNLRKGLNGGYKYKRVQVSGMARYQDKPDKNIYSHVCEALEYALVGAGEGEDLMSLRDSEAARYPSAYVGGKMPPVKRAYTPRQRRKTA